ncbi:MAG: hypothetical protein WDW36_005372 [Sanguina aurantia]
MQHLPPANRRKQRCSSSALRSSAVASQTSTPPWLAKLLYSRGIDLVRAEVIPDDVSDIKATLLRLRQVVGPTGMIFTSGGIGPTHDDVTYEAVAAATGTTLQVHLPTKERMQVAYDKRGIELNASRLRMATLPTPSEVLFTEGSWVPLVCVDGVYILPGIPKLFQSMIMGQQARFQGAAFCSAAVYTQMGEGDLAVALTKVAAAHPKVSIGSYPNTGTPHPISEYKVKLAFSGRDQAAVTAAVEAVRAAGLDVFDREA